MRIVSTFYMLLLLCCTSCGVVPINNTFEKAGTLKKGNIEVAGNISSYSYMPLGVASGSTKSNLDIKNIGARFGIGLSDKADLKFRYERLVSSNVEGYNQMSYYSFVPKFALTDDEFSLLVPVSLYQYKNDDWNDESSSTTGSIAPQLLYTFTNTRKKADFTVGVKGDLLFGGGGAIFLFGGSLGAGFSNDLTKWAVRPEVGATFLSGTLIWSYGIGVHYTLPKKR
jgi:hypothetical protein